MKKKRIIIVLSALLISLSSCNSSKGDVSSESLESAAISSDCENDSADIIDGKYYFTSGNGYIEITEGKYFQLIDLDDEFIDELVKKYSEMGSVQSLYLDEYYRERNNITWNKEEVKEKALKSIQLKTELVENKAEFKINIVPDMMYYCNSDCELTYFLDEVGLWFPVIYLYNDKPVKLLNEQFGYEFVLEEQ